VAADLDVRPLGQGERDFVDARLPLSRLDHPGGEYLVAWAAGEPVGHAHIDWAADPPELQDVFVPESRRRQGIASALTKAAEQRAAARGRSRLALEVSESKNPAARRLYEQLGYGPTAGPPRRVFGTILIRGEPFEVDDTLVRLEKTLGVGVAPR
jgi:GNAT superfamily N-acetyltransferase